MEKLTPKRVSILFRRIFLPLSDVLDLRANRGRQTPLPALLRLMVVAIACGYRKLRAAEALSKTMSAKLRRHLGLRARGVSDTALYEMLHRTPRYGFRQALWQLLRSDLERKAITNDLFAGGIASYDGKCAGWGKGERPNKHCQKHFFHHGEDASWRLFALRACLTSSSARPVLDQELLTDEGEATAFKAVFERDVDKFPRLFRYVTADAGIISAENAQTVVGAGKHYLFALKGNLRALYDQALAAVDSVSAQTEAEAETSEPYRGKLVVRKLYRAPVGATCRFPGAAQFVCVITSHIDAKGRDKRDARFFVTSVPADELSPARLLKLVRAHWGIENGPNWTHDVILREDTHCPCRQGNGLVVMSWLNLIAYNLVAVFRAHLPRTDSRRPSWSSVLRAVYHALLDWVPTGAVAEVL